MPMRFMLVLVAGLLLPIGVGLGEEAAPPPSTTTIEPVSVPEAFERALPRSVEDLRQMQEHVTTLTPRLVECTVNLKVGRAQGSGVIVTPDGYVLTAAHVSGRPGRTITVITADRTEYEAETLGRNNALDASLVKIKSDREDWPHCKMAEQKCKPGDWSIVLGHPGGYDEQRGTVLRLGRVILRNDWLVQTDCELVGGDSGGPLFNIRGEIIGVNTRIGESTDFNFHVPVETYRRDWDRMVAGEEFRTHSGAYLGVSGEKNPDGPGLTITKVYRDDPADRAGVKEGDVLLTFDGQKVTDLPQLTELVGEQIPGRRVKLELLRDGETVEITLRLGMRWK
jgi:serine protease Do